MYTNKVVESIQETSNRQFLLASLKVLLQSVTLRGAGLELNKLCNALLDLQFVLTNIDLLNH